MQSSHHDPHDTNSRRGQQGSAMSRSSTADTDVSGGLEEHKGLLRLSLASSVRHSGKHKMEEVEVLVADEQDEEEEEEEKTDDLDHIIIEIPGSSDENDMSLHDDDDDDDDGHGNGSDDDDHDQASPIDKLMESSHGGRDDDGDDDQKDGHEGSQTRQRRKKLLWWRIPTVKQIGYRLYAFALFFTSAIVWFFAAYFMLGPALMKPLSGPVFALGLLYFVSGIAGYIVNKLLPFLPPLYGMLAAGVLLRNAHPSILGALQTEDMREWAYTIRMMALAVILILAGLSVQLRTMVKKGLPTLMLSTLPNIAETVAVASIAKALLDIPWTWSFMLGFIVCPLSPSILAPMARRLEEKGYGVKKEIPTIIRSAASFDNMTILSGFGVCFSLIFDQTNTGTVMKLLNGPLELLLGVACGFICGLVLSLAKFTRSDGMRTLLAVGFSTAMVYGGLYFEKRAAGGLSAFLAMTVLTETWFLHKRRAIIRRVAKMWIFAQPVLIGTVGAFVDLSVMEWQVVTIAIVIIAVGLVVRFVSSFLCVQFDGSLNVKEKLYIAIIWMPKAALQVVLSTMVLFETQQQGRPESELMYAQKIVTIATLSVLGAPVSSFLSHVLGPVLLSKGRNRKKRKKRKSKMQKQKKEMELQEDKKIAINGDDDEPTPIKLQEMRVMALLPDNESTQTSVTHRSHRSAA